MFFVIFFFWNYMIPDYVSLGTGETSSRKQTSLFGFCCFIHNSGGSRILYRVDRIYWLISLKITCSIIPICITIPDRLLIIILDHDVGQGLGRPPPKSAPDSQLISSTQITKNKFFFHINHQKTILLLSLLCTFMSLSFTIFISTATI